MANDSRDYNVEAEKHFMKKQKNKQRTAMPMKKMVIDNIIYPVQTKRGLKWGK